MLLPATILNQMYDETLSLIGKTQRYGQLNRRHTSPAHLCLSGEFSQVAAKLAHILAWILGQKAVLAGEITQTEATQRFNILNQSNRISFQRPTKPLHKKAIQSPFPKELIELMSQSQDLMKRIHTLALQITRPRGTSLH